jgi:spore photoproduct lyase
MDAGDPLAIHYAGKQALVLGEHCSAVRFSSEEGNTCPNYWHFSPYGFCPYDCKYCYLAGTPGVRFSPAVKIFLNLGEMLSQIDRAAASAGQPTAFYLGKLQDGLALDPLTGYMRTMIPFFAGQRFARLTLLTKSADVENLLDLDHRGHTILSWSLNPPEVSRIFEANTPPVESRIEAMCRCAAAGYPIRAVVMPVIPVPDWDLVYSGFIEQLLNRVRLERITIGGICIYRSAQDLMERKLGRGNAVSELLACEPSRASDGRRRYPFERRVEVYRHLIRTISRIEPALPIALCLEEVAVFQALGRTGSVGHCNCVL